MSPVGGEGMVPEFMAGLNSVPRMGRRSMNPFMRSALGGGGSTSTNSGGFRFLNSRPRRRSGPYNPFGGGFPAFRFVGGPGLYQVGNKISTPSFFNPVKFLSCTKLLSNYSCHSLFLGCSQI